jgi:uncharacterized protein (DUF58 family)
MARERLFDEEFLARLERLAHVARRIVASSATPGQRRSRRLGDGLEFADHRAYAPGDDLRFLDWPYFARMERLLLRLFHEHTEGIVGILVDASASMAAGGGRKFDHARRIAAALAYVAMACLDRVTVAPFAAGLGEPMEAGRNRARIVEILRYLEGLTPGGTTDVQASLADYGRRFSQTGSLFVVTDAFADTAGLSEGLALLGGRGDEVLVLHVVDAGDSEPELSGPVRLVDAETGRRRDLQPSAEMLAAYRRRWALHAGQVERTCIRRGGLYVRAPDDVPFETVVLQTLRRIGRRDA